MRLGNNDPRLICWFLRFLEKIYRIDKKRLRFGLQLFSDKSKTKALKYWCKELDVSAEQFQKVIITKTKKRGTYRKKSETGVLTIYFSNTKLRDSIIRAIKVLQDEDATLAQLVERIHGESR